MATWRACSRAVVPQHVSFAMKPRRATLVSTLVWQLRWLSSRFLAGRAASSGICTLKAVTPSSFIPKRRWSWSAGMLGEGGGYRLSADARGTARYRLCGYRTWRLGLYAD